MERPVTIPNGKIELEAALCRGSGTVGLVMTHPHPLMGGDMDNPVVKAVVQAFGAIGFTTLRFNFRGTGQSGGRFDQGAGEQDDVNAAVSWLRCEGVESVCLAGYSFGCWVNCALLTAGFEVENHVLISPPAALMDFDLIRIQAADLVVTGAMDDIAPPAMVRDLLDRWQISTRLEIIPGCDHFYAGGLDPLSGLIQTAFQNRS